jgi:predicted AAA+ superfamily ATPase
VEDLQTAVVTGVRKQGKTTLMELNGANGLLVETKSLVGLVRKLEIVPEKSFITV